MTRQPELSVIIPVGQRSDDLEKLHSSYSRSLDACGLSYEVVYVLDGALDAAIAQLSVLRDAGQRIKVIQLSKRFGEAAALMAGVSHSVGSKILTLPAYFQIEAPEIERVLDASRAADMVVARRWPRRGTVFERMRRACFHGLLRMVTGEKFRDLGCSVRAFDRSVIDDINLYGDQHRLLPVLAAKQGFRIVEIDVSQAQEDRFLGRYRAREYLHRILDMLTVFFLVRFTKKPLRFFGMIGSTIFAVGAAVFVVLIVQRLVFDQALADRPALLLSSLLVVLGVQLFALGLLGELIIFTHARDLKEYRIAEIVEAESDSTEDMKSAGRTPLASSFQ